MKKFIFVTILLISATAAGIWFTKPVSKNPTAEAIKLSVQETYKKLQENDNIVIIDVREPDEYTAGHLKNSILLPLGTLEQTIGSAVKNKETPILVYCRSGNRSKQAQVILLAKGYTDVTDMSGGFTNWAAAGYPVEK